MDRALGAGRLAFLERAFLETLAGVGQKITALSARLVTSMLAATVFFSPAILGCFWLMARPFYRQDRSLCLPPKANTLRL